MVEQQNHEKLRAWLTQAADTCQHIGRAIGRELAATGRAVYQQAARLYAFVHSQFLEWGCERECRRNREALGQAAFDSGVGAPELTSRLSEVEDRITSIKLARGSVRALRQERRGLLLRLADAAFSDPKPEYQDEYDSLKTSSDELGSRRSETNSHWRALPPASTADRLRVSSAGVASILVLFGVVAALVPSRGKPTILAGSPTPSGATAISAVRDEARMSQAIALVVVGVKAERFDGSQAECNLGHGSAFAVTDRGLFLTNEHVVDRSEANFLAGFIRPKVRSASTCVWVVHGGEKYEAEVVYRFPEVDAAVLRIEPMQNHPYFRLSGDDSIPRASSVFACGYPSAAMIALSEEEILEQVIREELIWHGDVRESFKSRDLEYVLTAGTVSRVTHEGHGAAAWVQHDADIHPGNSGGPLITEDGRVVGINTIKHGEASGISFALQTMQLRSVLDAIDTDIEWQ